MKERLNKVGVVESLDDSFHQLFCDDSPYCNPFREVSTHHLQQKFLKKNFSLTVCSSDVVFMNCYSNTYSIGTTTHSSWKAYEMERVWTKKEVHFEKR